MMSQRKRRPLSPRTGAMLAEPDPIPTYNQSYTPEHEVSIIEEGDQVRHKIMDYLNTGLPLQVIATDQYNALCSYTDEMNKPVITWYEKTALVFVSTAKEDDQIED